MEKYISGLDENVIEWRIRNKKRILSRMHANKQSWNDWNWLVKHIIRNEIELNHLIELSPEERSAIRTAKMSKLPFGITPYYISLMDQSTYTKNDHAIRSQVIPPLS